MESHVVALTAKQRNLKRMRRDGAGDGNRTHVSSLGSYSSTIELRPRCRCSLCAGPGVAQEIGAMRLQRAMFPKRPAMMARQMRKGLQSRRLAFRGVGAEAPPTTGIQSHWFTSPHLPYPARHTAGQGRQRRAVLRSCRRSSRTARCRVRATGRWWWRGRRCSRSPTAWSARPAPPTRSCGRS